MHVAVNQSTGTIHLVAPGGVATLCGIDTTPPPHRLDPWMIGHVPESRRADLCRRCATKEGSSRHAQLAPQPPARQAHPAHHP